MLRFIVVMFLLFNCPLLASGVTICPVDPWAMRTDWVDSDKFVLGPTSPGKWQWDLPLDQVKTVSYSFMDSGIRLDGLTVKDGNISPNYSVALDEFMPVGYQVEIRNAFNSWSEIANIVFVEKPDPGTGFYFDLDEPESGNSYSVDIRIAGHLFDGTKGALAHAYFPPENSYAAAGDIHFDSEDSWKIGNGWDGWNSFDIFHVTAHEIGHSIGLHHTDVPNSLLNPIYPLQKPPVGPQSDDIEGAVFLYGPVAIVPEMTSLAFIMGGLICLAFATDLGRLWMGGNSVPVPQDDIL